MGLAELILKNVDFSYGKNKVLQDINKSMIENVKVYENSVND